MRAFWDLSTCRNNGFGLGAIPWTAIRDYAGVYQLDEENTEAFCLIIREMDQVYLEWEAEEAEARRKATEK